MFQTIESAALTVQTQFGVNYEIGKFTTLRIKWYGINIISWKCVRLAFDVSLTINLCTLCTLNRKPRQVLQTLLTMYRCSSRVLAEPEAGLPTKCSTDHISCFETSHSKKGTLSFNMLNRKLVSKKMQTYLSLFFLCAMSKRVLW